MKFHIAAISKVGFNVKSKEINENLIYKNFPVCSSSDFVQQGSLACVYDFLPIKTSKVGKHFHTDLSDNKSSLTTSRLSLGRGHGDT